MHLAKRILTFIDFDIGYQSFGAPLPNKRTSWKKKRHSEIINPYNFPIVATKPSIIFTPCTAALKHNQPLHC
jgi:hypothetical protein